MINTINLGLRGGGGISDYLILKSKMNDHSFLGRFFFDLGFFIFINLILMGMFFGIIVDSFAEYRDGISKRQKDIENNCFVCGLTKETIEKKGIEFQ